MPSPDADDGEAHSDARAEQRVAVQGGSGCRFLKQHEQIVH